MKYLKLYESYDVTEEEYELFGIDSIQVQDYFMNFIDDGYSVSVMSCQILVGDDISKMRWTNPKNKRVVLYGRKATIELYVMPKERNIETNLKSAFVVNLNRKSTRNSDDLEDYDVKDFTKLLRKRIFGNNLELISLQKVERYSGRDQNKFYYSFFLIPKAH